MSGRLDGARRRAAVAKRTLAGAAAVGFLVTAGLARVSHPGRAQASTPAATTSSTSTFIAPTQFAPQVATHVS